MARVFVCHSSKDNYFVGFLVALLRAHHVDVWADSRIEAGDEFIVEIEAALRDSDTFIAVLSHNAPGSVSWLAREISTFRAVHPDGRIIPLVLDDKVAPDEIFEGLKLVHQLRCYQDLLQAMTDLMSLLGRQLFPTSERRGPDRRQNQPDRRRAGSVAQRMRKGLTDGYLAQSRLREFDHIEWMSELNPLVNFTMASSSPMRSFTYHDKQSGDLIEFESMPFEAIVFASWKGNVERGTKGVAYTLDGIVQLLMEQYDVRNRDKREQTNRRDG